MAASPSAPGPPGRSTARPASIPMPAPWSRAAANCRSAPATASPSTRAPTTAGAPLDGRCDVVLAGITPQARYWTITLYDPNGRLVANSVQRHGFTSQEIMRSADGSFEIMVGAARAARQLAADRRHRALRAGAAALRHADRRRHARGREAPMPDDHAEGMPMIRLALWLLGGVLLGGIVHLATVLMLPESRDAGRLFAACAGDAGQCGQRRCRRRRRRSALLPFMDPAFAMAVCRYDLADGPLKFSVPVSPAYTSVSFYTRYDVAYYAINDRAAGRRVIELDLMTSEQRAELPGRRGGHRGRPADRGIADADRPDRDQGAGARAGPAAGVCNPRWRRRSARSKRSNRTQGS